MEFFQDGNSRQVSATYTVSAANTWEHKEVTIDGDTASALANDTTSQLAVYHWLGGGSNFTSGTLNTSGFAAVTNANRAPGTINIADSTSNEFYLTGAQLEVGNTATPFEHRSFGDELAGVSGTILTRDNKPSDHLVIGQAIRSARIELSVFPAINANLSMTIYSPNETAGKVAVYTMLVLILVRALVLQQKTTVCTTFLVVRSNHSQLLCF